MRIDCAFSKMVPIEELRPNQKNPNKHPEDQLNRLAELIRYYGVKHPVIVSKRSGFIVAGHGRLEAMRRLGMKEIPVDYQDFESDEQEYGFLVADNSIADWADLSLAEINLEVPSLGPDFDIDMLAIKDFKIDIAENTLDQPKEKQKKPKSCPHCGETIEG